ncbi:hypothetical protein LMG27174_03455 [Paraburkholderia rhynchosiae]|uniref:Uncharacterized protein n=1 Tax=Paraburkholderia rhynchosiae TaxID=487049 RepID=A0A6J5B9C2_9BURK|nr:hypothetical protein LMG27174_03455 [Paraburkholderia rhynchosiae]
MDRACNVQQLAAAEPGQAARRFPVTECGGTLRATACRTDTPAYHARSTASPSASANWMQREQQAQGQGQGQGAFS